MTKYLLGIDLGTTNIKGSLIRDDGSVIASASRANRLITSHQGWAEQSALQWWDNACQILT